MQRSAIVVVRSAALLVATVVVGGCAAAMQASFATTEPSCQANQTACKQTCQQDPRSTECQVLAVEIGEEVVQTNNARHLAPPALRGLHSQLLGVCQSGVQRACTADEKLLVVVQGTGTATAPSASAARPHTAADDVKQANAIVDRALAVQKVGADASVLDGTAEMIKVRGQLANCTAKEVCAQMAQEMEQTSKVGVWLGLADAAIHPLRDALVARSAELDVDWRSAQSIIAHEQDVANAEALVQKAHDEAQRTADARAAAKAAEKAKYDAEVQPIQDAIDACSKDVKGCRDRCGLKFDYPACHALGVAEFKAGKFDEATFDLNRACNNGLQHACEAIQALGKAQEQQNEHRDWLWGQVTLAGDEVARAEWDIEKLNKHEVGSKRYAERLRDAINRHQAVTEEQLCPVKKKFVAAASAADYERRAAAHCKNEPSRGDGYSGGTVTLPAECRAAYATQCR